ncbi:hypothetical protein ABZX93_33800 [Streptomyces sp. NPDC006632]|uniref:hypothetical protein n=1 Tax=Streptomyces sp. NPDC006632 TaxID=3157182 RepID=UPI0033A9C0C5
MAADLIAVVGGVAAVAVGVHPHDVERRPVDVLDGNGRVRDPPAEPRPDRFGHLPQKRVDLPGDLLERGRALRRRRTQGVHPVVEGLSGEIAAREHTDLAPADQHDLGAGPAQRLGPLGTVDEVGQHLLVRHFAGER